ncbi:hypothetical protein [[Clostridium] polysaccharolyticum]|uniref:Uncharacterized protein n=1 Tax=[Clostridium] polysaccharolyticum TaxID=29364 RepID=A0A1H9Y850_9FIRM|nr:hypothetical protein [[Clostridium] polysaccharolyticum]SES64971.1 hypothetical protein SAMN04487772_101204 [[Clostridium] polysaccharolyticum]
MDESSRQLMNRIILSEEVVIEVESLKLFSWLKARRNANRKE